jgi:hypothetical protein
MLANFWKLVKKRPATKVTLYSWRTVDPRNIEATSIVTFAGKLCLKLSWTRVF